MQQVILIAAVLTIAVGGFVAMVVGRLRAGDGPPPIADPYDELYSEVRGQVIARPLGEPYAGQRREELREDDGLGAAEPDTDTVELEPAHPFAWRPDRGESAY